jgi:cell wall-associated NlpC family hydrolase
MTTNNYTTTNEFVPTQVVSDPNGRSSSNPDLAFDTLITSEKNFSNLLKRHAYERLNDSRLAKSNPQFNTGSAGRLTSLIDSGTGGNTAQISRGYIRRSNINSTDPTDGYRLYFMYNPENIQRDYVAYIEQQALDPFNTIYGANNLVAPPGILNFQFSLFFDRQTENANGSMPRGVLEDYDYFDLVVRGVIPGEQTNPIQDNGIMMINPRNITVVFSPQLSVQGRAFRASVQYQKFDHKMTPTRMVITLSMTVFYFGPIKEDFSFSSTQDAGTFEATIPYDENLQYEVTYTDVQEASLIDDVNLINASTGVNNARGAINSIRANIGPLNGSARERALQAAMSLGNSTVQYDQVRPIDMGDNPAYLDCSGLVIWAYGKAGALEAIGQSAGYGYTGSLLDKAFELGTVIAGKGTLAPFNDDFIANYLQPGDLILSREIHVAFVKEVRDGVVYTYESTPPWRTPGAGGPRSLNFSFGAIYGSPNNHTHAIRPAGAGNDTFLNVGTLGLRV